MSQRIARFLLAVAARRWPAHLREELHQEWAAELHVLAEECRHARMLRYAASLAIARPARQPSVPAAAPLTGGWRIARLMLVAPLITMALLIASLLAMNVVVGLVGYPFGMDLQLPLLTLFALASAVLLARLARRWTVTGAPTVLLVLAVTVPGFTVGVLANALFGGTHKVAVHAPAYAVFFLGLGAVLAAVARLAGAGRGRAAWGIGILGAVLVADIAVMLPVLGTNAPPEEAPHLASAPVWLFTALTDSGFGLPSPTGMEIFIIGDAVELDALLYLVFTALALGAVIAGARQTTSVGKEERVTLFGCDTSGSYSYP